MIFVTTALGRDVPQYEWEAVLKDLVLKVLHDFRMSPFNPNNLPLTRTQLATAAGLSPDEVDATAEALRQQGLLERVPTNREPAYRITTDGLLFVRSTPQGLASVNAG